MGSFSGVGIGLCFVLGGVLLGLVGAEVYYLFWWKKRSSGSSAIQGCFCLLLCWRKPTREEVTNSVKKSQQEEDLEMGPPKIIKVQSSGGEDSAEMIMRMHNLRGPPRFLFTIKEEEGLEYSSDDDDNWKSSRLQAATATARRSLSDLIFGDNNGTLLPTKTSAATATHHHQWMTNPLSEAEDQFYRLRSSPPPNLKFLKDAEDKLIIKRLALADRKKPRSEEEEDTRMGMGGAHHRHQHEEAVKSAGGSFVSFLNKGLLRDHHQPSSAQVLPLSLCSSPTTTSNPPSHAN